LCKKNAAERNLILGGEENGENAMISPKKYKAMVTKESRQRS